jgi:limonene-1,2-epoxide hydrolase
MRTFETANPPPAPNAALDGMEARCEAIAWQFMAAWGSRDPEQVVRLLADDVVYMIYEGGPVKNGPAEIREVLARFMPRWRRIEFRVQRLAVVGPLVINERHEEYDGVEGQPDWRFFVAGLLVVQDGKIRLWRDYTLPGKKQIFD